MDRQEFWSVINQTRWGTEREVSANVLRGAILKATSKEQATAFSEHFFDIHTDLMKKMLLENDCTLDDELYEIAGDLIGFGLEKFQSLYGESPEKIQDESCCSSCFTDAIPFKLDTINKNFCNEDWFWHQISMMDWGNSEKRSAKIKEHLVLTLPPERLFLLREHFDRLWSPLRELALSVNLGGGFTDDDLDDLTAHVIGLGQETYYKVLKDPKCLVKHSFDHRQYFFSSMPYVTLRSDSTCYIDW